MERVDQIEEELVDLIDRMDKLLQHGDPAAVDKLFNVDRRVIQLVKNRFLTL